LIGRQEERARMGVVFIEGSTVRTFVDDEPAFLKSVEPIFKDLDVNSDGVLSRAELRPAFERLNLLEAHFGVQDKKTPAELQVIYDKVFEQFDTDHNEIVDKSEFIEQVKQMLLAVADGLGNNPFNILVQDGSILEVAAAHKQAVAKKA
jgi:Ca2+-binding EF-hand superfamily protein